MSRFVDPILNCGYYNPAKAKMKKLTLTAIIEREADGFVAFCPELDVASQGDCRDEARRNLQEAVEAFLEVASATEIKSRLNPERYVESLEVNVA